MDVIKEAKKFEEIVAACNRCGFCTSYCPTYNATGNEAHTPRGRNQAFRALLEGRLKDPSLIEEAVDTCLLCNECTNVCFAEVPTAHLMVQARHVINQVKGLPKSLDIVLRRILPVPRRLALVLKLAFWGKRLGVAWLLQKSGLLKAVSPVLAAAEPLVKRVSTTFLMERRETLPYQERTFQQKERAFFLAQQQVSMARQKGRQVAATILKKTEKRPLRPKVALMPVCGSQYISPHVGLATIKLLEKLRMDMMIPDLVCCGLPAASTGVLEHVKKLARENVDRLEKGRFEAIITDDSSCTSHIKDYPKFFDDDRLWHDKAFQVAGKVRELSSFLLQWGLAELLKKTPWKGPSVAYHDPCKAQHHQKITNPPRQLLESIPGLKLLSIAEADQCCGGGGTYSFAQPELSQAVLEKKIDNIIRSACKIIVTSSASCLIQLQFGLRKKGSTVEALHLTEFLLRALEKGK